MEIKIGAQLSITEAFRLAIKEGERGFGSVSPNPAVGCVFLDKDHRLLSVGHHEFFGGPHAEVNAFQNIKDLSELKGGRAVVTLEPCAHVGKTPPCAEMLAKLPLSDVHYGLPDPNPLVNRQGIKILEAAGIKVFEAPGEIKNELEDLAEIFLVNQRYNEIFVGLKLASSLDGMMALPGGESQWITSSLARDHGHFLRAKYGAVLSTARSVKRDNSALNSRLQKFENKVIPAIVVDEDGISADFLKSSRLLSVRSPNDLLIFTDSLNKSKFDWLPKKSVEVVDKKDSYLDLSQVFLRLRDLGFSSVLVEAGPQLTSTLVAEGLFHRIELFMGNKILGSSSTGSWTKDLRSKSIEQALALQGVKFTPFGEDILISGRNPKSFNPLFS